MLCWRLVLYLKEMEIECLSFGLIILSTTLYHWWRIIWVWSHFGRGIVDCSRWCKILWLITVFLEFLPGVEERYLSKRGFQGWVFVLFGYGDYGFIFPMRWYVLCVKYSAVMFVIIFSGSLCIIWYGILFGPGAVFKKLLKIVNRSSGIVMGLSIRFGVFWSIACFIYFFPISFSVFSCIDFWGLVLLG